MQKSFWPHNNKKKKSGVWMWILLVVAVFLLFWLWKSRGPRDLYFEPDTKVVLLKGETVSKFYSELSSVEVFWFKWYLRNNPEAFTSLLEGSYTLSGSYTASEFLKHLAQWPEQEYAIVRILEGWSIYDIDANLTKKGLVNEWEYIAYVTNSEKISALSERYDFFDSTLISLEGFLYPDTYHVDAKADVVKELVSIQLNTRKNKIWNEYSPAFASLETQYGLNIYKAVILASIVEKEEKNSENKPTVAGIFYNRLQRGMGIEADITLCYNFKQPYAMCTPSVIVKNIYDTKNPYNTRQVAGLTPTPIANPDVDTMKAILFPKKSSYLFYLHDVNGQIHYAETNEGHVRNKNQYL